MQKTTIVMPEGLYERIKRMAAERGESMGQLIRESLEDTASRYQPRPKSIGMGASNYRTTGRDAGEIEYEPDEWRSS